MELDEALIGAYFFDKMRRPENRLPWSASQVGKSSEVTMSKDPDYDTPDGKDFQSPPGQPVPPSSSPRRCSESDRINKTKHVSHRLVAEQRNNHAANREDSMSTPSLNSMTLLPDGQVRIKEAYMRGAQTEPISQQTHQPADLSKAQPSCSRPKVQMTRLSAGLRETKPNSLRVIKDPEEVLRLKRKLVTGASHPQYNSVTETASSISHHFREGQENISSRKLISKIQSGAKERSHHTGRKARPPSPAELIDIEDVPFNTLDDRQDFKLRLEESLKKNFRYRGTKKDLEETFATFSDVTTNESQNQRFTNGHEIVNIHYGDLKESFSSIENEEQKDSKHELHEITPDIKTHGQDKPGDEGLHLTKTRTKDKKEKKNKLKKPFKWLSKIKSAKVTPLQLPEEDTTRSQKRSKEDLERIAAMFCVETPAQASLRELLSNNDYVDDEEDRFIKPGIWDCDIGRQDGSRKRKVKVARDKTDVKLIANRLGNLDFNNNAQVSENRLRTHVNKVENWFRKFFKGSQ